MRSGSVSGGLWPGMRFSISVPLCIIKTNIVQPNASPTTPFDTFWIRDDLSDFPGQRRRIKVT